MIKLSKDLALALLNATLLLIAVCLFLAWKTSVKVDGMVATFASHLEVVGPLRTDVQDMRGEIAALHSDLAALASQTGEAGSAKLEAVRQRVAGIDSRLSEAGAKIDALVQEPARLVDQIITTTMSTAADEFSGAVNHIRGCSPPGS